MPAAHGFERLGSAFERALSDLRRELLVASAGATLAMTAKGRTVLCMYRNQNLGSETWQTLPNCSLV